MFDGVAIIPTVVGINSSVLECIFIIPKIKSNQIKVQNKQVQSEWNYVNAVVLVKFIVSTDHGSITSTIIVILENATIK